MKIFVLTAAFSAFGASGLAADPTPAVAPFTADRAAVHLGMAVQCRDIYGDGDIVPLTLSRIEELKDDLPDNMGVEEYRKLAQPGALETQEPNRLWEMLCSRLREQMLRTR